MTNSSKAPKAFILEVDDDRDIRELVTRVLKADGYEVASASDGAQALSFIAVRKPDLVLLDMKMPGKSGSEVLKEIRFLHPGLPVILVTGVTDMEAASAALANGANGYLLKPFQRSELLRSIAETLASGPTG
ncbi:MAG: response regulator, partial [Chloroflexi bacterium]|nr:response regulator [Chloroflexota bacterium]